METNTIPNIQIENIGTRGRPHYAIKGFIELSCWTGYFLTEQPNYLIKTKVVTNGRIDLWIDGEITNGKSYRIDSEQVNAYNFLIENQVPVQLSILQALKDEFPRLLAEEYFSLDHDDSGLPRLTDLTPEFDFKSHIGPTSVSIGEEVKDEVAYTRWHFNCLWDPEHGFEVITHKDRVIDLSPDVDVFKINKDNGTYEALEMELSNKEWKAPKKKKWWQFW